MQTTPGPSSDAAIPAYLSALGLPGIADAHVHFMPQNVLDKVWAFFDHVGDGDGHQPWPIAYRTGESERIATLARLGVIAYPTLNYAHRPGMAAWLNAYSRDFAAHHPHAVPSGTFFAEQSATADAEAALADGARIFKIHVQVGGFAPDDPVLDGAWSALASAQVPTVIHCGSGPHAGRYTGPDRIATLLHRHPDLPLIIAHGGMPEYGGFTDLAERHPGVHLDTTMVGTDYAQASMPVPAEVLVRWRRMPQKIVLGTDFPNIPYPYAHQIRVLADLGFGDDWMRAVLWHNGARLMRVASPAG
ncbi:amidohydrolase family protein [Microbacterium kribbense]|uniref:Amidohydrolase family protein n=1 Tax=Microbacterium kribbense TaxID=433645 RepID=A0ABP7GJB9_9MICO